MIRFMRGIFVFFLIGWVAVGDGIANVITTAERGVVLQLQQAISSYQVVNAGKFPVDWNDLNSASLLDYLNERLAKARSSGYPIQNHYQFVDRDVSLGVVSKDPQKNYEGSRIVLIRVAPLRGVLVDGSASDYIGRYVIYRTKNGKVLSVNLPEESVQEMLNVAGLTLTSTTALSEIESEVVMSEKEFLKLHPELDPNRKIPSPSHDGPLSEPALAVSKESQPSSNAVPQLTVAVTAQEKGIGWWVIGGGVALVVAAAAWLIRRSKPPRK